MSANHRRRGSSSPTSHGAFSFSGPIRLPNAPFGQVVGTGTLERTNICLPEWARGTIRTLEVSLPARGTDCAQATTGEFIFDDLAVVEDVTCEDPGLVFDPGFERVAQGAKVSYTRPVPNYVDFTASFGRITSVGFLHVRGSYPDCSSTFSATQKGSAFLSAPRPPVGAVGGAPKVSFNYRTSSGANGSFSMSGHPLTATPTVAPAGICMARSTAGQGLVLDFAVTNGCPASSADLYVDDVALAWDPACP